MATKKVGSAGRLRASYGKTVRHKLAAVEKKQRVKQTCPYCGKLGVKRLSMGIWSCKKCGKKFASHAYIINKV